MGSDRSRKTYDPGRQYRSVVEQQGRVILDADLNEAQEIAEGARRVETIDVVGPLATPDNGYAISVPWPPPSGFLTNDFAVGPGSMYVGGERVTLRAPGTTYFTQPEWLDGPVPGLGLTLPPYEMVYLLLTEQEVSAVEDTALRDPALGGPDTAQRTRLVQHIVRATVTSTTGPGALAQLATAWSAAGQLYVPASAALASQGSLKAGFTSPSSGSDPCQPLAQTGYLGQENQLFRVQIASSSAILWALDDASCLYRASVVSTGTGTTTLQLTTLPVDSFHSPALGQYAEVLLVAAELDAGSSAADASYVAAGTGFVAQISTGYNPGTQTVVLAGNLPTQYASVASGVPLFVRVWQNMLSFTPDTAVTLGNTGVSVTLHNPPFVVGDYWMFAVRPNAATTILPERYLNAFQPPEGPHRWICPLAVILWSLGGGAPTISDCRIPFAPLVGITLGGGTPLVPRGTYSAVLTYTLNNLVYYEGSTYLALGTTTGNLPTNTTYWELFAEVGAAGPPGVAGPAGAAGATGPTGPAGVPLVPLLVPFPGVAGTETTSSATFVYEGAIALDPTTLFAAGGTTGITRQFQFRTIVQATPGVTVQVQLYNVTAGAVVSGTTLTSTTAAQTAPQALLATGLSLPGSMQVYVVQLRISSPSIPGTSDLAICLLAQLEVTWS
jgi:hypothetical protein